MTKSIAFLSALFAFGALSIATAQSEWTVTSNGSMNAKSGEIEYFAYPVVDLSSFDLVPGTPMYWLGENLRDVTYSNGAKVVDAFPDQVGLPYFDDLEVVQHYGGGGFSSGVMIRTDGLYPFLEGMGTMYNARAVYRNYFEAEEEAFGSRYPKYDNMGLCPDGTRLPTMAEVRSLLESFGGGDLALKALTLDQFSYGFLNLKKSVGGGNNQSGLGFLPGFSAAEDALYELNGDFSPCYWTSTLAMDSTAFWNYRMNGGRVGELQGHVYPMSFTSYAWSYEGWGELEYGGVGLDWSLGGREEYELSMHEKMAEFETIDVEDDYGNLTGESFEVYYTSLPTIVDDLEKFCFVRCVMPDVAE